MKYYCYGFRTLLIYLTHFVSYIKIHLSSSKKTGAKVVHNSIVGWHWGHPKGGEGNTLKWMRGHPKGGGEHSKGGGGHPEGDRGHPKEGAGHPKEGAGHRKEGDTLKEVGDTL